MVQAIKWDQGVLSLLDQRVLPQEVKYITCTDYKQTAKAIKDMVVRGAPAIGISGGYGLALAASEAADKFGSGNDSPEILAAAEQFLREAASVLVSARPTAVNLPWAVERVLKKAVSALRHGGASGAAEVALAEARSIELEDIEVNRRIGVNGAALIKPGSNVMTHCNAGALATGGWGTALGVIRQAWSDNRVLMVYANETRPFLQGARLTAWELMQDGIPVTLLADSAAGYVMSLGRIDAVVVGADRIAANGDVANKIGTYTLACLCKLHNIPFYVAAPMSTFDLSLATGREIQIEERSETEILEFMGKPVAPAGARAFNPSFDITPAELISAIITENGTVFPPLDKNLASVVK
ncbi:MAG TPA: S-methyl-5-thioribose-1-phosphate isomerase [Firmicutes bacterium]|nr:S-methyl-5-thioribose-1-phosphate isomerase [Bacillota bacterium]